MSIIKFSINNPLLANMLLVLVVIIGILSWYAMPQEIFPVIEKDQVSINTQFKGAPPADVENQITIPIEQAFEGKDDIDFIKSSSSEGLSAIIIKLKSGANVDDFLRLARSELDQLKTLPTEAEKPVLKRVVTRFPVISVAVFGGRERSQLFAAVEIVKKKIYASVKGVGSVGVAGDRKWEIWVIVRPDTLASSRVSLQQVANALSQNLKDLPGGSVKAVEGDILLRGQGAKPDPENIRKIVLKHKVNGGQLLLGEVARVESRLEEAKTLGRFGRKKSVNLVISKTASASTIEVSAQVKKLVLELQKGNSLPANVSVEAFGDLSKIVESRLNTVKSSGLVGLIFVLISLYVFLNFRIALITAMGIPVSFLIAVAFLYYFGYTINMVSMFAFLIALGMIVDDAIIVGENIWIWQVKCQENPTNASRAFRFSYSDAAARAVRVRRL